MTLLGDMQPAMPCISRVDFPCKVHDLVAFITDMHNQRQCIHVYLVFHLTCHGSKFFILQVITVGREEGGGVKHICICT